MKNKKLDKVLSVWESYKILKPVDKELYIDIIDQIASLFAAGSFYYFILNFVNLEMEVVHNGTKQVLGIGPEKFTLESLSSIMHPEDQEVIHKKEASAGNFLFNKIPKEDLPLYKVVYLMRLRHTDGSYKTILHQSKTLVVSDDGRIQKTLVIHTDVSYLNIPYDNKVSFISNKRPSYYSIDTGENYQLIEDNCQKKLTTREKEIVKRLSEGRDFNEIASLLHVSPHTINTHKKNIFKKVGCKNATELVAKCIREGVI